MQNSFRTAEMQDCAVLYELLSTHKKCLFYLHKVIYYLACAISETSSSVQALGRLQST